MQDLNSNVEELGKMIEQDYNTLKGQLNGYLEAAKERLNKRSATLAKAKLEEIENAIQKLGTVKSFEEIVESQKSMASNLRRELESTGTLDDALFIQIYNCVNVFVHEGKLAKASIQEAEDYRKQFKSKKFEVVCKVFQDYQQTQKDDQSKLQDILSEYYDHKKTSEIKTFFKEKLDKVFGSEVEAMQIDHHKTSELGGSKAVQLVAPVKHNSHKTMQTTDPLAKLIETMSNELGTILDSTRIHFLSSTPLVSTLLKAELERRKARQLIQQQREKKVISQEQNRSNSQTGKQKYDIFSSIALPYEPALVEQFGKEKSSQPSLLQIAKSVIKEQPSTNLDTILMKTNQKEIVVDVVLEKLKKMETSLQSGNHATKNPEKLSDLVAQPKPAIDIYEAVYGAKNSKKNKIQSDIEEQRIENHHSRGRQERAKDIAQSSLQNEQKQRHTQQEFTKSREMKENRFRSGDQTRAKANQENIEMAYTKREDHRRKVHYQSEGLNTQTMPQERPEISVQKQKQFEEPEDNAMRVIQTFVIGNQEGYNVPQEPKKMINSLLTKRPPQRRPVTDGKQDYILYNQEETSVLKPLKMNQESSQQDTANFKITADCKILPYKLNRSNTDGLVHANHSEFQLSKGNSFYFTGSEPFDFIEIVLQKETFVSSLLIEPPKLSSNFFKNLSKIDGACLVMKKNGNWERLCNIDFKDKKQLIVPVNTRASVLRIAHGNKIDNDTALGVGRLVVMG